MRPAVLRPGDRVVFDAGEHQVLGLVGTSVRLRSDDGVEQVVLASHLLSCTDFELLGHVEPVGVEPFGLLDGLPADVVDAARAWERHVVEVETGLAPGTEPGTVPRDGFDPGVSTVSQRAERKAAELGVSVRTVHSRRAR